MYPLYHSVMRLTCCLMVQVQGTRNVGTGSASKDCVRNGQESEVRQCNSDPRTEDRMKTSDKSRKWMWWFLVIGMAMQLYFVRELLAAFALFALGFGVVAFVIGALYMLHQGWAVAVE